jgi:hypothetical protein
MVLGFNHRNAPEIILDFGFWILDFGFWILASALSQMVEK